MWCWKGTKSNWCGMERWLRFVLYHIVDFCVVFVTIDNASRKMETTVVSFMPPLHPGGWTPLPITSTACSTGGGAWAPINAIIAAVVTLSCLCWYKEFVKQTMIWKTFVYTLPIFLRVIKEAVNKRFDFVSLSLSKYQIVKGKFHSQGFFLRWCDIWFHCILPKIGSCDIMITVGSNS